MEEKNTKPKKGDEIVITPNKAAFEGSCVGRTEDGFTIFISGCVPGLSLIHISEPTRPY